MDMIKENEKMLFIGFDEGRIIIIKKIRLKILENNVIIANNKYIFYSMISSIYKTIFSDFLHQIN